MLTTVNLPVSIIRYATDVALSVNMKRREFIALCLRRKIKVMCKSPYFFTRQAVKYQPRGVAYGIIKIDFSWDEYDANLLCRFFRKFSVSLLTTISIFEYAKEIEDELNGRKEKSDNYFWMPTILSKLKLTNIENKSEIITKYQIIQKKEKKQNQKT
jgi:hypothetical protein